MSAALHGPTLRRRAPGAVAPQGAVRLLAGLTGSDGPESLAAHLERVGWLPDRSHRRGAALLEEIHRSGLRGHGGAWFPTARKWEATATRPLSRPVVVANAAEGEPASGKDRLLVRRAPHLVLDGLAVAAVAVGATRAVLYVPAGEARRLHGVLHERRRFGVDPLDVEVVPAVDRFVAGEESAVVAHLNGGPGGLPAFTGLQPVYRRGVAGRPTLVQNVETLAHAALIARFGAGWFRSVGTEASPGTGLLTVTAGDGGPRVVEIPFGATLRSVLGVLGVPLRSLEGVLLGGYGGAWLGVATALDVPLAEEHLRPLGATLGAGVVVALDDRHCPLAETAAVVRYLAEQSAGQCGPCLHGVPAMAEVAEALAFGPAAGIRPPALSGRGPRARLLELCDLVDGRGACHHPDGAARLVRSALVTFADHVDDHRRFGPCRRAHVPGPAASAIPAIAAGRGAR